MIRLLLLVPALLLALPPSASAQVPDPVLTAKAAILVDLGSLDDPDDDEVLFASNADEVRPMASLTKVATALVARDAYLLDEVVVAGPRAAAQHGSRLGLAEGMEVTVEDLLYALLLKSGNDAATALAEHHPAGYDHFIELMDQKARAIGASSTSFRNPHGLDANGHNSTARDMALFGRQLLADPVLAAISRTPGHVIEGRIWPDGRRVFDNHNRLVRQGRAIGVKTGFTNKAGRSLIAATERGSRTILTVVLGSQDHYVDTEALWGYHEALTSLEGDDGGSVIGVLGGPPEKPFVALDAEEAAAAARFDDGYRWAALMAVLAAAMLATLPRTRQPDPLAEAAEHLPYLGSVLGQERTG